MFNYWVKSLFPLSLGCFVSFVCFSSSQENCNGHRRGHWNGQGGHCGTHGVNVLVLSLATTRMLFRRILSTKIKISMWLVSDPKLIFPDGNSDFCGPLDAVAFPLPR